MPIITISRQFGSSGGDVAGLLRNELKCNYLDKDSLEETFRESGLSQENIDRYDEKDPGFWAHFRSDKIRYLHFLKGVIYEWAGRGSCIIMGRGGQTLLEGIPGILHVRLIAPPAVRLARVMKRFECDESHAQKIIQRSDHERAGFHKFFFDRDWEDNNLYDLVVNTGSFSAKATAEMILSIIQSQEFTAALTETGQRVADLTLAHHVKTTLLFDEKIPIQFLEVVIQSGTAILRGIVLEQSEVDRCEEIAAAVPGVKKIKNEIFCKPIAISYGMHY